MFGSKIIFFKFYQKRQTSLISACFQLSLSKARREKPLLAKRISFQMQISLSKLNPVIVFVAIKFVVSFSMLSFLQFGDFVVFVCYLTFYFTELS